MNKLLTLIALSSAGFLSAGQYQSYGHGSYNDGYYDQSGNYRSNQRQGSQGNYQQRNPYYDQQRNQGYDRNNQYDYQQSNQGYQYNTEQQPYQGQYDYQQRTSDGSSNYSQMSNSDQQIAQRIRDAIGSGWFTKGYQNVNFDVNNGLVTLRGNVENRDDLKKVEDHVRKIEGVRQINNQIRVAQNQNNTSNTYTDSNKKYTAQDMGTTDQDRAINTRIREKLNGGWFSKGYDTIVLRTANGIVVISGMVDTQDDMQKIHNQVKDIDGVKSVNNQLNVKNR